MLFGSKTSRLRAPLSASDKAYIGEEAAKRIAFDHAGVAADAVSRLKVEFDSEDGVMTYEIDFYSGNMEYEYDIDAKTGDIVKYDIDNHRNVENNNTGNTSNTITRDEALNIALKHAGASNVTTKKIELDDNSYEIEFIYNNKEYDYDISLTGKILEYSIDSYYDDDDYKQIKAGSNSHFEPIESIELIAYKG